MSFEEFIERGIKRRHPEWFGGEAVKAPERPVKASVVSEAVQTPKPAPVATQATVGDVAEVVGGDWTEEPEEWWDR